MDVSKNVRVDLAVSLLPLVEGFSGLGNSAGNSSVTVFHTVSRLTSK